jgi:hypothetical protein
VLKHGPCVNGCEVETRRHGSCLRKESSEQEVSNSQWESDCVGKGKWKGKRKAHLVERSWDDGEWEEEGEEMGGWVEVERFRVEKEEEE